MKKRIAFFMTLAMLCSSMNTGFIASAEKIVTEEETQIEEPVQENAVATVSSSGVITAKKAGTAIITVKCREHQTHL